MHLGVDEANGGGPFCFHLISRFISLNIHPSFVKRGGDTRWHCLYAFRIKYFNGRDRLGLEKGRRAPSRQAVDYSRIKVWSGTCKESERSRLSALLSPRFLLQDIARLPGEYMNWWPSHIYGQDKAMPPTSTPPPLRVAGERGEAMCFHWPGPEYVLGCMMLVPTGSNLWETMGSTGPRQVYALRGVSYMILEKSGNELFNNIRTDI